MLAGARTSSYYYELLFTLKSILKQKKNYGNSNISPCKKIYTLEKILLRETKILQYIITLYLISNSNTSQNIIFQKILI